MGMGHGLEKEEQQEEEVVDGAVLYLKPHWSPELSYLHLCHSCDILSHFKACTSICVLSPPLSDTLQAFLSSCA